MSLKYIAAAAAAKYIAAAAAALLAISASAEADTGSNTASTIIRIQGYVPVICHVELDAMVSAADEDGVANLGTANEFCNAPRGYRVLVEHPQDLVGAAIISEGVRIPLSPTGETILTNSSRPDLRQVALAVDLGDEPERFRSLGVRIEAKG